MGPTFVIREGESVELTHYGILGMKWGVRRFQNPDGTLTEAGKKRYGTAENYEAVMRAKADAKASAEVYKYQKKTAAKEQAEARRAEEKQFKYEKALLKKKLTSLTDKEIEIVKKRLELEDSVRKAMDKGASKEVKNLVGDILKTSVRDIGSQGMSYILGTAVNKFLGPLINGIDSGTVDKIKSEISGMKDDELSDALKRLKNEEEYLRAKGGYNTNITNPSKAQKPK